MSAVNHRGLVELASQLELIEALHRDDVFGVVIDSDSRPGTVWFRCPRCNEPRDHQHGNAHATIGSDRWSCLRCRHAGTRYELERLVLEDGEALDLLVERARERRAVRRAG